MLTKQIHWHAHLNRSPFTHTIYTKCRVMQGQWPPEYNPQHPYLAYIYIFTHITHIQLIYLIVHAGTIYDTAQLHMSHY